MHAREATKAQLLPQIGSALSESVFRATHLLPLVPITYQVHTWRNVGHWPCTSYRTNEQYDGGVTI